MIFFRDSFPLSDVAKLFQTQMTRKNTHPNQPLCCKFITAAGFRPRVSGQNSEKKKEIKKKSKPNPLTHLSDWNSPSVIAALLVHRVVKNVVAALVTGFEFVREPVGVFSTARFNVVVTKFTSFFQVHKRGNS